MATGIILGGAAVSVSRSAVLGIVAVFVVMACNWPIRRTLSYLAIVGGCAVIGMFFGSSLFNAYSAMFGLGLDEASANSRQAAAESLLAKIPFWGVYGEGGSALNPPTLDDEYLSRLQQIGVFGLLSYLAMLVTTLTLAFLAYRNARNRVNADLPVSSAHLFLALGASVTAYAVMSIFLDVDGFIQTWTIMWLLIAASAVAFRISRGSRCEVGSTAVQP